MRASSLLLVLLVAAPAIVHAADLPTQPRPTRLSLAADAPEPMPVGADQQIRFTVERTLDGDPAPGPGRVNLTLEHGGKAGCRPTTQILHLDPTTGQASANITCEPDRVGQAPLVAVARSGADDPGRWNASLPVHPDTLVGELAIGEPDGYRFPANLSLTPEHLDQAHVRVRLEADRAESALGFQTDPFDTVADGSPITRELVALHGGGDYELRAQAEGPRVRTWNATSTVSVPQPPSDAELSIDVEVDEADANLSLASDPANEDGKHNAPGEAVTTRFHVEGSEAVNVTVSRAEGGAEVPVSRAIVEAGPDGEAEHVFAHEPLPAGRLTVEGHVGEARAQRNVTIEDRSTTYELTGPERFAHGRAWQGNLTLHDPNFGSTPTDPGPVGGLPDLEWTVYKGARWGSVEAESFDVQMGAWTGTSNGTADASTITWPEDGDNVTVGDGWARLPVRLHPSADAQARDYRLSIYEAASGDLVTTASFELHRVELEPTREPRAGQVWPVEVSTANLAENATLALTLTHEGQPVANGTLAGDGTWTPELPSPLPANTTLRLEAHVDPNATGPPDALLEHEMPELAPTVAVHPVLDGAPTRTPIALHPAHAHEVEVAYHAYDGNTGPLNVSRVQLTGPEGDPGWPLDRPKEKLVRLEVPEGLAPGRYTLAFHLAEQPVVEEVGLEVGRIVRLAAQAPDQVHLQPGETTTVDVNVTNQGNVGLEQVRVALDTELAVEANITHGKQRVPADEAIDVDLTPGQTRQLTVELAAGEDVEDGSLSLALAGVVP